MESIPRFISNPGKLSMKSGLGDTGLGLSRTSIYARVPEIPTMATEATASRDEVAVKPASILQRRWRINATGQSSTRWNFSTMSPTAQPAAKNCFRWTSEYDQINRAR